MIKSELRQLIYDILEEREGDLDDQTDGVLEVLAEEGIIHESETES